MRTALLLLALLFSPSCLWAEVNVDTLRVFEGLTITQINYEGNNTTKEFVIDRQLGLEVGETLTMAKLEGGYQNLENLGIFGSIDVIARRDGDGVALDFIFKEFPPFVPYVAFKYTEENGFSVGPALSSVNLFGRAIRVSGRVLFGGTTQFILSSNYPWITGNHVSLDLTANHIIRKDKLNGFEENSDELTPWVGTWLGEKGRAKGMIGYFRMKSDVNGKTLDPDNTDDFFRMGAGMGYDSRDSWRVPHDGWQNEVEVIADFGSGNFVTTTVDLRRFQPLSPNQTVFLGALTSLRTGAVGVDVPEYLQYRMGGANSIRGYDIDELGRELYGKNQFIGTIEYQYMVLPLQAYNFLKWSAALGLQLAGFVDTGIAWSDPEDFNTTRWKSGYGFGVRLLIPGSEMTRFDIGFNGNGDVYFHFGNWFKWTAQRFWLR
ncbi:MAG: BamA/TamA family outer membrane protein [bacterium]